MIQTVNPTTTAEIMSRYRPIAPKPELPPQSGGNADGGGITCKSPYLRNVWPHLQARPTRTRKRTRATAAAAHFSPAKRQQQHQRAVAAAQNENGNGISLVPCRIDLNSSAAPQELDFLQQLQQPLKQPVIISPRPVRPVGSTIIVDQIIVSKGQFTTEKGRIEDVDVEAMVEAEHAPAIISDVNNKVRMVNSAYKEMIGQPECGWLDCASLVSGSTCNGGKRIGGGVSLHFADSSYQHMHIAGVHGFFCQVKIEWEESDGRRKKKSVAASCKAERIDCPAKNYHFLWRFQTVESPDSDN